VSRKRITAANSKRSAKKKRESLSSNPYLATTKPELQMRVNIQGAAKTSFFIVERTSAG
jgi:hypothetical protein